MRWTNTNPQETMLLVGIILATGIHCLPSLEDYWSQNPLLGAPGAPGAPGIIMIQGINEVSAPK